MKSVTTILLGVLAIVLVVGGVLLYQRDGVTQSVEGVKRVVNNLSAPEEIPR